MASPGFIAGIAKRFQSAIDAARFTGDANLAAMVNHFVRKRDPVVLGNDLHQIFFHRDRLGLAGKFKPPG